MVVNIDLYSCFSVEFFRLADSLRYAVKYNERIIFLFISVHIMDDRVGTGNIPAQTFLHRLQVNIYLRIRKYLSQIQGSSAAGSGAVSVGILMSADPDPLAVLY